MSEVKKREKIPDELLPPEVPKTDEVKIVVGDKEYPIPIVKAKEYKKILKFRKQQEEAASEAGELENIEMAQEFYYRLLKPHHPELKKEDMDDMPLHQFSTEFFVKVTLALYRVPLPSALARDKA